MDSRFKYTDWSEQIHPDPDDVVKRLQIWSEPHSGLSPDEALHPLWMIADDIDHEERARLEGHLPSRSISRCSLESFQNAPFKSKAILRMEPDLGLMSCFEPATRSVMPRSETPKIMVIRPSDGILVAEQQESRKTCLQREAIILDATKETTFIATGVSRFDCFILSTESDQHNAIAIDMMKRIEQDNGALIVLGHYAAALMRGLLPMNSALLASLATDYMHSLVSAMVDTASVAQAPPRSSPTRSQPSLIAIKADIEVRLGQRDLSLTSFATARGVTVRHLQKLFEAEGRTFSDYVLERRLERARQLLLNTVVIPQPISTIAFDLGFGDLSYFNRTFKKRFGITPRETRARSIALVNASGVEN
ncbi:MAG: helix-turn-helix transcriptional regulator [Afipia sp.]